MGKVKPQYTQKFREEWLKNHKYVGWLSRSVGDDTKAFCKVCHCNIRARLADIENHSETKKHKAAAAPFSNESQTKITNTFRPVVQSLERSNAEGSLALFVAAHCAIMSCDHLSEMCKNRFSDSGAARQLQLHRTKCSALIKNVLGPYFENDLKDDIGDGIGTDNASVMVGINNGVYQLLKREVPHLVLIRCVCHSIQLATSAAMAECLPRNLDFLVRETYNWFSRSTSRRCFTAKFSVL